MNWKRFADLSHRNVWCCVEDDRLLYTDGLIGVDLPMSPEVLIAELPATDWPKSRPPMTAERLRGALAAEPAEWHPTDRADLLAWLPSGLVVDDECWNCDGNGAFACPDERCHHTHGCDECDETGEVKVLRRAPVRVFGDAIDGALLWHVATWMPDEFRMGIATDPKGPMLVLAADDRRAVIMGMRDDGFKLFKLAEWPEDLRVREFPA